MIVPARYYSFEFRKLSVGECWRLRLNFSGFLALYRLKAGIAAPPQMTECIPEVWPAVPADEISSAARQVIAPPLRELRDAGFTMTHYGADPMLEPGRHRFKVLLLSDDRRTGVIVDSLHQFGNVAVNVGLTSRLSDGSFRVTSTNRNAFKLYPHRHWDGHPGWSADRLYERHLDNLDRWVGGSRLEATTYRLDEGAEVSVMLAKRAAEKLVERGIFHELTGDELDGYRERLAGGS